jgi:hypothetical protein
LSGQVKYRLPPTLPSFFPVGSSSSIPTHRGAGSPGPNSLATFESGVGMVGAGPTNRIVPLRICGGLDGSTMARFPSSIPVLTN